MSVDKQPGVAGIIALRFSAGPCVLSKHYSPRKMKLKPCVTDSEPALISQKGTTKYTHNPWGKIKACRMKCMCKICTPKMKKYRDRNFIDSIKFKLKENGFIFVLM